MNYTYAQMSQAELEYIVDNTPPTDEPCHCAVKELKKRFPTSTRIPQP